jgi:Lipocalin-like domain
MRQRLIGTWRLVSYDLRGEDGSAVYPMGRDVDGLIMYAPNGYMSANLMIPGRPAYSGGAGASATQAELAAAAAGYFGYAGKFEVDEAAGVVIHRIEVALMPNLAGTTQRRYISMDGICLTLRGDPMPAGTTPYIIWDRLP